MSDSPTALHWKQNPSLKYFWPTTSRCPKATCSYLDLFIQTTAAFVNGPYSYSRSWTGTSLQLRLMRGVFMFSNADGINLLLIPVQYQENTANMIC